MSEIGALIRQERKKAGMTQAELSNAIGCAEGISIRHWEKGHRDPSLKSVKRIADALGITIDKLLPQEWLSQNPVMGLNDYQRLAARTIRKDLVREQVHHHALHGMVGEIGELHGLYQKSYQGHVIDQDHLKKEVGDLLWFIAEYCTSMGWALEDVAQVNIDKLKARFPAGFEVDKSLHRKEGDI